uniref:RNA helicase n=1 Tax=Hirondellea gigas TaxID=1518452 RepID=A0A2P2IA97_9CRUS
MASKLPFMLKGSIQGTTILTNNVVVPRETLPIITVPLNYTKKILRIKEAKEKQQRQKEYMLSKRVVISCKNKMMNFYQGQTYSKFDQVPLASQGWMKRKSNGDTFTIHATGKNPALLSEDVSFAELGLCPEIVTALRSMKLTKPTNVQNAAIPVIRSGHNTLIAAETGNGKTLAFMLPLLEELWQMKESSLMRSRPHNSPVVLVIAPGRELAEQIKNVCEKIAAPLSLNIECVVGADRTKLKITNPKMSHPDVLIASLGVLSKLITHRIVRTSCVRHVVLDEVDTLLDDSFCEKLRYVLLKIPMRGNVEEAAGEEEGQELITGAQLVMAGATLPRSLDTQLENIIELNTLQRVSTVALHRSLPHITQRFLRLSSSQKVERILTMAREAHKKKRPTLVFSNDCDTVNWLGHTFKENDIDCVHVTGKLNSYFRKSLYEQFRNGNSNLMSCSDLVSRGLDTIRAQHVINYDFPKYMADYIHRCGRVGRVGSNFNQPLVTNFISKIAEAELAQSIEYAVRKAEPLPNVNANIKGLYTAESVEIEKERAIKEERKANKKKDFSADYYEEEQDH